MRLKQTPVARVDHTKYLLGSEIFGLSNYAAWEVFSIILDNRILGYLTTAFGSGGGDCDHLQS